MYLAFNATLKKEKVEIFKEVWQSEEDKFQHPLFVAEFETVKHVACHSSLDALQDLH